MRSNHNNNLRKKYFRRYYRKNRAKLLARSNRNHTSGRIVEARFRRYVDHKRRDIKLDAHSNVVVHFT